MTTAHDAPKQCKIGFQPVALFSDRSRYRRRSRYRSVALVESVFWGCGSAVDRFAQARLNRHEKD
jgi:hypothetical protein